MQTAHTAGRRAFAVVFVLFFSCAEFVSASAGCKASHSSSELQQHGCEGVHIRMIGVAWHESDHLGKDGSVVRGGPGAESADGEAENSVPWQEVVQAARHTARIL